MNKLENEIESCLANALVKAGIGASIGVAISLAMYKRRPIWPITAGTGFGLGMSYSECNL
jgi:inner membrane organizing system protein 1